MHGLPAATNAAADDDEVADPTPSRRPSRRRLLAEIRDDRRTLAVRRLRQAWLRAQVALRIKPPPEPALILAPLDATSVRSLMIPRALLNSVSIDAGIDEVRSVMSGQHNGRLPVLDADENAIGVLHVIDVSAVDDNANSNWKSKLVRVPILFEGASARTALKTMVQAGRRDAAVLDEHGGLVGWLTETQLAEVATPAMDIDDGAVIDGTFGVQLLAEALDMDAPLVHSESVGGLITERLGHFAQAGESIELEDWQLTVVEATAFRVLSVRLDRLPEPEPVKTPAA